MNIEQRIEDLQRELDLLKVETSYFKDDPTEPEWPRNGDEYYFISGEGDIMFTSWLGSDFDKGRLAMGNCHRTKADALRRKATWMAMGEKPQPIETAPKDGTDILAWHGRWQIISWTPNSGLGRGRWLDEEGDVLYPAPKA